MKKFGQRLLSVLLAVGMLLSAFPLSAFAEGDENLITPEEVKQQSVYRIQSGGIYNIKEGQYVTEKNAIAVYTKNPVTLNITGNITGSEKVALITAQQEDADLTIQSNANYTVSAGNADVFTNGSGTARINGGIYEATTDTAAPVIGNVCGGVLSVRNATIRVTGTKDSGQAITNSDSTLNIYDGTVIDNGPMAEYDCIANGIVNLYGGTITAGAKKSAAIRADKAIVTGGTIQNSKYGIYVRYKALPAEIDGNVIFENNTEDVHLDPGQTFTLTDKYTLDHAITVGTAETLGENTRRQITTSGTSTEKMLKYVASANPAYSVGYDPNGQYLYLWNHTHTWQFTATGNMITAVCTDPDCEYHTDALTLTLNAPEAAVEGETDKSYEASFKDDLAVTGAEVGKIIYEGINGTDYPSSETAPVKAGTYRASLTIENAAASVDYTIAPRTYTITLVHCTGKNEAVKDETVTVTAEEMPGKEFTGWNVTENVTNLDQSKTGELTFTMPDGDVTVKAEFKEIAYEPGKPVVPEQPSEPTTPDTPSEPEKPDTPSTPEEPAKPSEPTMPDTPSEPEKPDIPKLDPEPVEDFSAGVAGAVIVGTGAAVLGTGAAAVGWDAYYIGTELYLKWVLPFGIIPTTRETLALMLWNDADQPAPQNSAYYSDIDENNPESQAAARWAVENALLKPGQEDDTAFVPDGFVNIFEVAKAWKKAQKLKN